MGTNRRHRRRFIRQGIAVIVGAALIAAAVFYTDKAIRPSDQIEIWFEGPGGKKTSKFYVKIADTEEKRNFGLMYEKAMAPENGMIFVYKDEGRRSFWMKNTYIPLDMIFISADFTVVGVVENAQPMTTLLRNVNGQSKFVVELNGGVAAKEGIESGSKLKLLGSMPNAVN